MNLIRAAIVSLILIFCAQLEAKAENGHSTEEQNPPVQTSPSLVQPEISKPTCDGKDVRDQNEHYTPPKVQITGIDRDLWDWVSFVGSVILAGVGVIGGYIGLSSLKLVRGQYLEIRRQRNTMQQTLTAMVRQTDVAEMSAVAAQASVDAIKAKERGRLSLEITGFEFNPLPSVRYKLTCHGTTPAYVTANWENTQLNNIPDYPWPKDAFGFPLQGVASVVPPGQIESESFIMGDETRKMPQEEIDEAFKDGTLYLHFRVRIAYADIFGGTDELIVAKVYGIENQRTGESVFLSPIYGSLGRYPDWRDSTYTYGDEDE